MERSLEAHVLGPPRLSIDGRRVSLSERQLALALRLVVAHPEPVPGHRLADVWPGAAASDGAVRVTLTRVRSALGPDSVVRRPGGYVLGPDVHLDAVEFERRLVAGRDHHRSLAERLDAVDSALGMWDGEAFQGVERLSWIEFEAVRLDEMREHARDLRFELLLERGDHEVLVADLRSALVRTPEHERRCEVLALALYRSGRQAEALAEIDALRRRLRDELGLSIGDGLATTERRILTHDPQLLTPLRSDSRRDPRLNSAIGLMREGIVDDADHIAEEAVADAYARGDRAGVAAALLVRAQAALVRGDAGAHAFIDEAQTIARSIGHGKLLARAALTRFGLGVPPDRTRAVVELAEPLEMLPTDAPERLELLCAAAVIVGVLDVDGASGRFLAAARRAFEHTGDERSEAVWSAARSITTSIAGDHSDEPVRDAARALDLARRVDDPAVLTAALHATLRCAYVAGNLSEVDRVAVELDDVAARAALPFGVARAELCRITNAIARGDLLHARELVERTPGRGLNTYAAPGASFAHALMLALEDETLAERLDVLRHLAGSSPVGPYHALAALAGDGSDQEILRAGLRRVGRPQTLPLLAALSALAARRHDDLAVARWAREHLARLGEHTVAIGFGTIVIGFAPSFLGLADHVLGDLDRAADRCRAAVALTDRAGARLWAVHARLGLADVLLDRDAAGDRLEAAALLATVADDVVTGRSVAASGRLQRLSRRSADADVH